MSKTNQNKINAASFIKYAFIAGLLMFAPIALFNQILLPVISA